MRITEGIRLDIMAYMNQNGLTQTKLAEVVGIKHVSVNHWLSGKAKNIRPGNWVKLKELMYPIKEVGDTNLSQKEYRLLKAYRNLPKELQDMQLITIESIYQAKKKN